MMSILIVGRWIYGNSILRIVDCIFETIFDNGGIGSRKSHYKSIDR